jgi:hypothetical protein
MHALITLVDMLQRSVSHSHTATRGFRRAYVLVSEEASLFVLKSRTKQVRDFVSKMSKLICFTLIRNAVVCMHVF